MCSKYVLNNCQLSIVFIDVCKYQLYIVNVVTCYIFKNEYVYLMKLYDINFTRKK